MKIAVKIALCFILFLAGSFASAKVLVVADIDDTLKVTNVRSVWGSASSFFDDTSRFAGMADLFNALKDSHAEIEFHYVSLAPEALMSERHQEFLEENNFPITALHTNPGLTQDPQLKQKVIRQLVKETQPELIIYFGDNGQFDPLVYSQMAREFPHIPYITYIHEVYSHSTEDINPTQANQVGFVTAMEVTLDLIQKGVLPLKTYLPIENKVYQVLRQESGDQAFGEMVFPWWQDCRDLQWQWADAMSTQRFQYIQDYVFRRCRLK